VKWIQIRFAERGETEKYFNFAEERKAPVVNVRLPSIARLALPTEDR